MAAPRRSDLIARRRRAHDDDGEEDASVAVNAEDDSSSQPSLPSDLDDDADAEGSEPSDAAAALKKNGAAKAPREPAVVPREDATANAAFPPEADTAAMMNGLKITDESGGIEEVDFDQSDPKAPSPADKNETLAERRRREHDEYKKRRDADPAFVPNRGGFFMHDQRSAPSGPNGFRPAGRGRGRGRGMGPFPPLGPVHTPSHPADSVWEHDLHVTVASESGPAESMKPNPSSQQPPRAGAPLPPQSQPNRSFSRTTQVGNVQLRVFITGMKEPVLFPAVPVHQHTRLPHHRPPLRRDKPVRVSLPAHPPRYIFPAVDRSFIFIPRALRPNQQGFGRGRGRGSFGLPSGRGSVYGGSAYSPSIAMSRRSSITRELGRDAMVSPTGSVMSRNRSMVMEGRPVVRLPPSADPHMAMPPPMMPPFATPPAPIVNLPMPPAYMQLQPQAPLSQESLPATLPMHQPRPQKAVSVAGIEGPRSPMAQPPPPLPLQPFHQQMPMAVNGQAYAPDPNLYSHARRPSHPSQRGTPLSQIPERAIHAQPFQPYTYQQPSYYPQPFAPVYYYPPTGPSMPSMAAPAFVPGQQYPYAVPPAGAEAPTAASGGGTVAHESNGMVYYYDPSQLPVAAEESHYPMGYPAGSGYVLPQPAVYYPTP